MKRIGDYLRRIRLSVALAKSIAVMLAYLVGNGITGHFHETSALTGAILACTSAIVVMQQQDTRHSFDKAWLRILGTFIGAVIACLYLLLFPFTLLGMIVSVFILEIICMLLAIPNNSKMSTITLIIILIVSRKSPDLSPLLNGVLRFSEAVIGTGIGIGMVWLMTCRKRSMTE